ncbi:MAG: amidohydrolase family protein [SAR324 cluster bacterium]|nr:amidohydrolase family protein [SAR324 cluster bacterium]
MASTKSAQIRSRLNHPVIDTDGHSLEFLPLFEDYLAQVGGPDMVERFKAVPRGENFHEPFEWHRLTPEERRDRRAYRPVWWIKPTRNTRDRATAMLPNLLRERMDEFGFDYTILYPTAGLTLLWEPEAEVRQAACRAFNTMQADLYREHAERMTPVAMIPAYTPDEAIAELEHAVRSNGLKAVAIGGHVRRPIPIVEREAPELAAYAQWMDLLALDSAFDYDPLWAKCVELGVAATSHGHVHGFGINASISSYVYNHIGKFGYAGEAFCKAVVLGGVTRRFPTLQFAFLEGGVAWAASLYAALIGHWEKRNAKELGHIDPANLDRAELEGLIRRHGGRLIEGREERLREVLDGFSTSHEDPALLDEFAACGIERAEDFQEVFLKNFYFGCEADDPTNVWAFRVPAERRLKAIFGSDIGHWDVPDMSAVLEEAYEVVEDGQIGEEDFRDFVFTHPARLHAGMNPGFFKGTVVEGAVERLLAESAD